MSSDWQVLPSAPGPDVPGWLDWYDLFVIHTSGGKDSQTALRRAVAVLGAAGALGRTAALHLWLDRPSEEGDGPRVEWPQVPELAAEQAARNGLPLADGDGWAVWNAHRGGAPLAGQEQFAGRMHYARRDFEGDLLDDIATRTKRDKVTMRGWPTMWTRYCTSDWKTSVGRAFTEHLCEQIRAERGLARPVRVLQMMGFRAEESTARANRPAFGFRQGVSAKASRHVWEWLPIHQLTTAQVWADIRESGVPYHPVYDEGMSRLSCRHCILGSAADLATSKRLSPHTAAAYERVEVDLGDAFQQNRPLASIPPSPGPAGFDVHWLTCPTCSVPVLANARSPQQHCPAHAPSGPWDRRHGAAPSCVQDALFNVTATS
jgi:Phosphoadenosine phosphosulfate reductase family